MVSSGGGNRTSADGVVFFYPDAVGIRGGSAGCKNAVGGRKDTVLEDRRNLEDLSFRAVGSVVFEGDRGMLRGWKNIYGVFKLLDLSHGSENKKFPDDGSDPVEYPDETGGFLSGELRIPD